MDWAEFFFQCSPLSVEPGQQSHGGFVSAVPMGMEVHGAGQWVTHGFPFFLGHCGAWCWSLRAAGTAGTLGGMCGLRYTTLCRDFMKTGNDNITETNQRVRLAAGFEEK